MKFFCARCLKSKQVKVVTERLVGEGTATYIECADCGKRGDPIYEDMAAAEMHGTMEALKAFMPEAEDVQNQVRRLLRRHMDELNPGLKQANASEYETEFTEFCRGIAAGVVAQHLSEALDAEFVYDAVAQLEGERVE